MDHPLIFFSNNKFKEKICSNYKFDKLILIYNNNLACHIYKKKAKKSNKI